MALRVLAMFRYATKLIALKVKRCQVFPLIASGTGEGGTRGEACLIYKHAMGVVDFPRCAAAFNGHTNQSHCRLPFYYYVWCALICCVSKLSGWLFFPACYRKIRNHNQHHCRLFMCVCAYPSSLAQLLFNCSRLTGNSSARQTDSQ